MFVSAYLEAGKVLDSSDAQQFALRSLDRISGRRLEARNKAMLHVIAYSDPAAEKREIAGVLDDYAFTDIACLDAYEATGAI